MNDGAALAGAVLVFGLFIVGLAGFGLAALRFGADSRRSADEERLGRPTTWI